MTKDETVLSTGNARMKPTRVRYWMILLAMLVAVLLYLDRICMSSAAESVAKDLNIKKTELDWLLGAFFWTYALGQLPAGWLGDRFGARWMLGAYIVLWSLSTGLLGFANGMMAVLILRLACGLFEAGAYPVAASIVRKWMPKEWRGFASSVVAVGGRLGGAAAPILTVQLMLLFSFGSDWFSLDADAQAANTSWRPVMIVYGVLGVLIAIVFVWFFRDHPETHPQVNEAEVDLIRGEVTKEAAKAESESKLPLVAMILSFPLWMNCFVQFASNLGWAFLVTKMPQYLKEVHGTPLQAQGWLQSLPLVAGIFGLLLGGLFTDFATQFFGLRWGRAVAMGVSRFVVAIAFFGCLFVDAPLEATLCLAIVGMATDLGTPACWAYGQDVGGKHVGSVVGWSNMWGNFGAAVSPVLLGVIVGMFENVTAGWQGAFLFCGVFNLVAAVSAIGINASKPLRA